MTIMWLQTASFVLLQRFTLILIIFLFLTETNADQEITHYFGSAFETFQIHGTVQSSYKSVTSSCLSTGITTL